MQQEDAATLDLSGPIAISTDSFVVKPLFFPGGDIGKLSVTGTVNDLLVMGATPRYLTTAFLLETGLDLSTLDEIVSRMAKTAKEAGVIIVAGDTKVVEGQGGLMINTTGIGSFVQGPAYHFKQCKEGDLILLSGCLGDHEASIMSCRMNLGNQIQSDCALLTPLVEQLRKDQIQIKAMRDVTRGGLGTILNEVSELTHCGVECFEQSLPIHKDTQAFCRILGFDPIYMANEGSLIALVSPYDGERALASMRKTPLGKNAAIIGRLTKASEVTLLTRLGGKRRLTPLQGESLPRIC